MGFTAADYILVTAGILASAACAVSLRLIVKHIYNMHNFSVQSKIVGIVWMIPIYSIDSFLSLWIPSIALYVDMLRDCYEVNPICYHSLHYILHFGISIFGVLQNFVNFFFRSCLFRILGTNDCFGVGLWFDMWGPRPLTVPTGVCVVSVSLLDAVIPGLSR